MGLSLHLYHFFNLDGLFRTNAGAEFRTFVMQFVIPLPVTEICNNFREYFRVDIPTKLPHDEPVSKVKSLHDDLDVF